ncbi:MAG: hypothetical protein GF393_00630 [Armatimonadia bacterium]|nr:hypothetical protein [Armatimonadia bacterium]
MKRLVICMVIATMLLSMGIVFAQEGLEQETCWYDRVCLFGYFQVRFIDTDSMDEFDNFDFRRGFFTIKGDIDDRSTGIITLARVGPDDPNIDLYNAFIDYKLSERYAIQAGQVPTWFGLEAWEGSSVRLPFERAKILEGGPGFWFAGAADRGVWLRRNPEGEEPMVVLGVWNGQFRSDDANDDKNISLDVKFNREWGQFGASWFDGEFYNAGPDVTQDRNAVDVYVRKFADPWGFQAEWVDGEMFGADRDGWYAQGMYDFQDGKNVAFARYEQFNAEPQAVVAAQGARPQAEYDGFTIGVRHQVYDSGFVTLQYTDGDWDRTGTVDGQSGDESEDLLGIQWQYNFR